MVHEDPLQSRAGLRRRKPRTAVAGRELLVKNQNEKSTSPPRPSSPSPASSFLILVACLSVSVVLMAAGIAFPKLKLNSMAGAEPTPQKPFDVSRAMRHVRKIAAKPRWVGTIALEESLLYIQSELNSLKSVALENDLQLEVEFFRSGAGSFTVDIAKIDLIISYSNISSVVARLRPSHLPSDTPVKSLLINAHVDSAAASPGASDNVCGVGVVMEVLRCIAASKVHELKRPIVFLFNGAEEAILVGAHSFIKHHPWASSVAAHINLESLGPGDSYHLFRLGPHSPWLGEAFANSVSAPSTSVTASDLFDSKVIPGETDFRVFSEFGGIPGYDFVLLDNGFVYHTIYDSIDNVDPLGVHHGGVTVIELALELAGRSDAIGLHEKDSSPSSLPDRLYAAAVELSNSLGLVMDPERPRAVFFDVLGMKTVAYEEGVAALFNVMVLFSTALIWVAKLTDEGKHAIKETLRMCAVLLGCALASLASATFASLVYTEVYRSKLRWYGSWTKAALMYAPPALFGTISALLMLLPRRLSGRRFEHMLFAFSVYHVVITVALMRLGFMTSYVPVVFLIVANVCAFQGERVHPVLRHLQLSTAHAMLGSKLVTTSLSSMLPILGRVRSENVPHDTIAAVLITFFAFNYLLLPSLPVLCYYARPLRRMQVFAFFISVGIGVWLLVLSPAVNGVRKNPTYDTDAPKRIFAIHFYSPQQEPRSVVVVGSQDPVQMDVNRIFSGISSTDISPISQPGFPVWGELESSAIETYRPLTKFLQEVTIYETEQPPNLPLPKVTILSEEELDVGWNVTFLVHAYDSHQLTVRFPVGKNSSVVSWSLDVPIREFSDGAWIRHVGSFDCQFWVVLTKGLHSSKRAKLRMAITSGRLGISKSTSLLGKLVFKKWEAPTFLVSTGVEFVL